LKILRCISKVYSQSFEVSVSKIVNISDVFISYSRRNTEFARKLNDVFKEQGMEVWADWEDIPKGADWRAEIAAGVEGANAFLFIISPDSAKSSECRHEIELAIANKKRIVPVLHVDLEDAESKTALHPAIGAHNWIFGRTKDDWEKTFSEILTTVQTDLDHVRAHTRLNVRAHEWNTRDKNSSFLLTGDEIQDAEAWLASSVDKTPQPTQLHSDYILASRKAAIRRQQRLLLGVSVALLVSLVLMVTAVVLGFEATNQRNRAETNEQIALTNEANAVSAQATAVRNADISQSIALASGALEADIHDQIEAVALAQEAVEIERPPAYSQRVLGEIAYQPGAMKTFTSEGGFTTSVEYSADGEYLVSSAEDGTLTLWAAMSGERVRAFEGHEDSIESVAFSPDSSLIASASQDNTIALWNVETGAKVNTLTGHTHQVLSVAFSPDGSMIVSGSRDGTLILWDVLTASSVRLFEGHSDRVTSVAFSPDGKRIVSGSRDDTSIIWEVDSGELLFTCTGHTDDINAIAFNPDGTSFATASSDRTLILWDSENCELLQTFISHTRAVLTVVFSPDGTTLLSGGNDRTVIWWGIDGEPIHVFTGLDFVRDVDFNPEGTAFISADRSSMLVEWSLENGNIVQQFFDHTASVSSVAYTTDGKLMATASDDQEIVIYSAGDIVQRLQGHETYVNTIAFSPNNQTLASADENGVIRLWDVETGQPLRDFEGHEQAVRSLSFTPDGQFLLSGAGVFVDGEMWLWNVETGEIVQTFEGFDGAVWGIDISPDGQMAASASEDNTVRLWSLKDGELIREFTGHTNAVRSVAFNGDGTLLLSGSFDQHLILWDVETGNSIRTFTGHTDVVRSVSIHGEYALSASDDDTVMLWNIFTAEALHVYRKHTDSVNTVAFSADGKTFTSGSKDSSVIVWRVDSLPQLIEWTVENRYIPILDCDVREQYQLETGSECS
jgi:WD40 repeat protein